MLIFVGPTVAHFWPLDCLSFGVHPSVKVSGLRLDTELSAHLGPLDVNVTCGSTNNAPGPILPCQI